MSTQTSGDKAVIRRRIQKIMAENIPPDYVPTPPTLAMIETLMLETWSAGAQVGNDHGFVEGYEEALSDMEATRA